MKVQGDTEIVGFLDTAMEPALAINENPLKWWALNVPKHPVIAHVAWNTPAVAALSGRSERALSHRGRDMTQRRNRFKPDRLES